MTTAKKFVFYVVRNMLAVYMHRFISEHATLPAGG